MNDFLPAVFARRNGDGFTIETPDSLLAFLSPDVGSKNAGTFFFRLPMTADRRLRDELIGEFGLGVRDPLPSGERPFVDNGGNELWVATKELNIGGIGEPWFLRVAGSPVLSVLNAVEDDATDDILGDGNSRVVFLPIVD